MTDNINEYNKEKFIIEEYNPKTNKKEKISCIINRNKTSKEAIIYCHGMFGNKEDGLGNTFLPIIIKDYNLIRFDFMGNGESSEEFSYADYKREVQNIKTVSKYIEDNLKLNIIAIIGHSKAGADMFLSAIDLKLNNNNDKVCFISLGGRLTFGTKEKRFNEEQLNEIYNKGFIMWEHKGKLWKITKDAIEERKYMNPIKDVQNIPQFRKSNILHIHGKNDISTPISEFDVIHNAIPGCSTIWIDNADHFFRGKEKEMCITVINWIKNKYNKL